MPTRTKATPKAPEKAPVAPEAPKAPEADASGGMTFSREPVPARNASSTAGPNPFADAFPADDTNGGALVVTLDGPPKVNGKDSPKVLTLKRQARAAAAALDLSARTHVSDVDGRTKFAVWTTKKITRPRKNGDTPMSETSPSNDNPGPASDPNPDAGDDGNDDDNASDTPDNAISGTVDEATTSADNPNTATGDNDSKDEAARVAAGTPEENGDVAS